MMLGFPPPLFFQICWRFVSPAIIFVSSSGPPPPLPLGQVSPWELAGREQENIPPARALPPAPALGIREGSIVRCVQTRRRQALA